jgi:hypothetical protein
LAAEPGHVTYVGDGSVSGLVGALPAHWVAGGEAGAIPFKGQFEFTSDGRLVHAQIGLERIEIQVTPTAEAGFYAVAAVRAGELATYGLRDARILPDRTTLQASLVAPGSTVTLAFDLSGVEETDEPAGFEPLGGIGPDVTVSRVGLGSQSSSPPDDFNYWGTANGIRAFSLASTSCNAGDQTAQWLQAPNNNHPVIAQNMFRLLDGKFEHIGQSWLKHSFCAVSEPTCGPCQATPCSSLGIWCADTYWATLNDGQDGGPKSLINPQGLGNNGTHTGHAYPDPTGPLAIAGRLQIKDADITAGGQNFAEIQYVTHDEDFEDRHNNASWREVNLNLTSITGVQPGQASVRWQQPGIFAWKENDPAVTLKFVDDAPNQGRFHIGYKVTDNGNGTWHYEYAIQNLNSSRAAGSFTMPVPDCVTVNNVGFHDVDYHSGEPYDGTDWPAVVQNGAITWSTTPYTQNVNANALRWGTLYNFRFDADAPPAEATLSLGLFKPGTPAEAAFTGAAPFAVCAPPCPADTNGDGLIDVGDLVNVVLQWGTDGQQEPGVDADTNDDGTVDVVDLVEVSLAWGKCA